MFLESEEFAYSTDRSLSWNEIVRIRNILGKDLRVEPPRTEADRIIFRTKDLDGTGSVLFCTTPTGGCFLVLRPGAEQVPSAVLVEAFQRSREVCSGESDNPRSFICDSIAMLKYVLAWIWSEKCYKPVQVYGGLAAIFFGLFLSYLKFAFSKEELRDIACAVGLEMLTLVNPGFLVCKKPEANVGRHHFSPQAAPVVKPLKWRLLGDFEVPKDYASHEVARHARR